MSDWFENNQTSSRITKRRNQCSQNKSRHFSQRCHQSSRMWICVRGQKWDPLTKLHQRSLVRCIPYFDNYMSFWGDTLYECFSSSLCLKNNKIKIVRCFLYWSPCWRCGEINMDSFLTYHMSPFCVSSAQACCNIAYTFTLFPTPFPDLFSAIWTTNWSPSYGTSLDSRGKNSWKVCTVSHITSTPPLPYHHHHHQPADCLQARNCSSTKSSNCWTGEPEGNLWVSSSLDRAAVIPLSTHSRIWSH